MSLINPVTLIIDTAVTCGGIVLIYAFIRSVSKKKGKN